VTIDRAPRGGWSGSPLLLVSYRNHARRSAWSIQISMRLAKDKARELSFSTCLIRGDSSTYRSAIASPLRSALAISPTCRPESLNTAPFSLRSTIARAPTTSAAPAPAPP